MGKGPFSVRQGAEGAQRADRGRTREGFYPASELSGEIKLLLLLCVVYSILARERGCVAVSNESNPFYVCMGLLFIV